VAKKFHGLVFTGIGCVFLCFIRSSASSSISSGAAFGRGGTLSFKSVEDVLKDIMFTKERIQVCEWKMIRFG